MTASNAQALRPHSTLNESDNNNNFQDCTIDVSYLHSQLTVLQSKTSTLVQDHKNQWDNELEHYRRAVLVEQSRVESGHQQLLMLHRRLSEEDSELEALEMNQENHENGISHQLSDKKTAIQADLDELQSLIVEKEVKVAELEGRVQLQQRKIDLAQERKSADYKSFTTAKNILTRQRNMYESIGLSFKGDEDNSLLRFVFTLLDPNDPGRSFGFSLGSSTDEDDEGSTENAEKYSVTAVDPILDDHHYQLQLKVLKEQLNQSDDLQSFVRKIRALFVQAIESSTS